MQYAVLRSIWTDIEHKTKTKGQNHKVAAFTSVAEVHTVQRSSWWWSFRSCRGCSCLCLVWMTMNLWSETVMWPLRTTVAERDKLPTSEQTERCWQTTGCLNKPSDEPGWGWKSLFLFLYILLPARRYGEKYLQTLIFKPSLLKCSLIVFLLRLVRLSERLFWSWLTVLDPEGQI